MDIENELPDSISVPICYGTISFWLGKKQKQQDDITHKWMAFVRGPDGQPLHNVVERVCFVLHDSFGDNKERNIAQAPFEMYEKGWGEFEMQIKIYFKKPFNKEPLTLIHQLGLHPTNPNQAPNTKKPIVSEFYEEIVFVNPSPEFYKNAKDCVALTPAQKEQKEIKQDKNDFYNHFTKFDPEEHRSKLDDALNVVKMEVDRLQEELQGKDRELQNLYKQINEYTVLK